MKWQRLPPCFQGDAYYQVAPGGGSDVALPLTRGSVTPRPKPVPTRKPHCWLAAGVTISDDLIHGQVQSVGLQVHQQVMPAPTGAPKNEAPFSLVIMLDGWMVRERGPQWAAPPDCQDAERVAWHEVKSGVIYRLDHRAETASGRGVLTQKKVVACPPGTDVLEFGATVQKEALRCGMARAQEVFVVVDGPSG